MSHEHTSIAPSWPEPETHDRDACRSVWIVDGHESRCHRAVRKHEQRGLFWHGRRSEGRYDARFARECDRQRALLLLLTLREANGTFDLHFVGNGSNGDQPLDFSNSVGLAGSWNGGGKTLPVSFNLEGMSFADANTGHRYGMITNETDDAFEARAQGFYFAALKGDPKQAARFVHFPLRVNWSATHHEMIDSASQLAANWNRIFTPKYLAALRDVVPHDMPVIKSQYAMLGAGLAFFTDKGVEVLNAQR